MKETIDTLKFKSKFLNCTVKSHAKLNFIVSADKSTLNQINSGIRCKDMHSFHTPQMV